MSLVAAVLLLSLGMPAFAHRLDEYLQATTISLEKDRIRAEIRLTPGVAVFPSVMAAIDTDGDGVISASEREAYADRVLGDLSVAANGDRLRLRRVSTVFSTTDEMKEGLGYIQIGFTAELRGNSSEHKLVYENHHQSSISVYLANCLVPVDPDLRVTGQKRNSEQSLYQLTYDQSGVTTNKLSVIWWSDGRVWAGALAMLLLARIGLLWRQQRV